MILTWDVRVVDFMKALQQFIQETNYNLTYDQEGAQEYTWLLINDPDIDILVNYDGDVFRGFAIVARDKEFQKEYFGFLSKFYIMPTGRGTTAARELMQEVVDWFDRRDCKYSFATATAGIGQDKLFINLLGKFGYELVGTALIRKQHE